MKRIIMIVTLLCVMASVSAQRTGFEDAVNNLVYTRESREDVQERLQQIAEQMASREAKVETVRLSDSEGGNAFWTDGRVCYYLHSSHDGKRRAKVVLEPFDTEIGHTLVFTPNRQGTLLLQGKGYSLQCARAGKWQMLIVRNQQGRAVELYTKSETQRDFYRFPLTVTWRDMHDAYDGLYQTATGNYVVFGPGECYDVKTYDRDPGCFFGVPVGTEDNNYTDRISYGGGRISRGNPSSEKYQMDMPGGGGAGAIMHAMVWALRPTAEGMDVKVVYDEPFVDHSPRLNETESLRHVASPYGETVPGQWAFASVRPVSRGMLHRFSKNVLRLMRNEIYARHGHRFPTAPDLQQHFDAQAWYQPRKTPTPLTAIEQLNVQIIQAEEADRQ